MYRPASFSVDETATLHDFIRAHGFATLVTRGAGGLVANHLPMLIDDADGPAGSLVGHMARANPQWRDIEGEALAVFSGPHSYISPTWYEASGTVPTWNYVAVHAYGTLRIVHEPEALLEILRRSVQAYEGSRATPWTFDESDLPLDKLLPSIVGFRLEIARLEGKWKLSQNHPEERRRRVIAALERQPDDDSQAIAALMKASI